MSTLARALLLIIGHLAVGGVIVLSLADKAQERGAELRELDRIAAEEHDRTARQQRDLEVQRNILAGLHRRDPYVIEFIARLRHGYAGENEVAPPMIEGPDPLDCLPSSFLEP